MNTTHPLPVIIGIGPTALAGNKVIRNTYLLLSMTLLFSAAVAGLGAIFFQVPALSLAVSAMFVLLMSAAWLHERRRLNLLRITATST